MHVYTHARLIKLLVACVYFHMCYTLSLNIIYCCSIRGLNPSFPILMGVQARERGKCSVSKLLEGQENRVLCQEEHHKEKFLNVSPAFTFFKSKLRNTKTNQFHKTVYNVQAHTHMHTVFHLGLALTKILRQTHCCHHHF